jgi:hypothetical protein
LGCRKYSLLEIDVGGLVWFGRQEGEAAKTLRNISLDEQQNTGWKLED